MACSHCCGNYGPIGEDITEDAFQVAMTYLVDSGQTYITLGGGEPTLHPKFWQLLGVALSFAHTDDLNLGLITNGSQTQTALALANIAQSADSLLHVSLSQDDFHDPIDSRVVRAFERLGGAYTGDRFNSHIRRTVWTSVVPLGRAAKWGPNKRARICGCGGPYIAYDGKLWVCGCQTVQLGTVFAPDQLDLEALEGEWPCSESPEMDKAVIIQHRQPALL